ncbi:molecular chaperone DnaJ [Marinobacter salinus]|uniref:Molecular chaperone DnaJ n=1 Tax=Marinobacter salinus TaxID=1874317 RepID=A0A1D9GJS0_9GAMM|nr:molecular chaperone DnaJ [Marinobacter salinus]AOY87784.1 molecular chaperone DnaJ [Marinobacter salinus]
MNCWEILGIEPTGDHERIQRAYEQQLKFASGEDANRLDQAFREATGQMPASPKGGPESEIPDEAPAAVDEPISGASNQPLDGNEGQVVREVVIQIKALLNDSSHSKDAGIWKAILCEPPADQSRLRAEIGRQLEPQIRPMAENGSFPESVTHFLGHWFGWSSLQAMPEEADERIYRESEVPEVGENEPPQMVNFWPAVIGWIIGLVILASFFGGMGGG